MTKSKPTQTLVYDIVSRLAPQCRAELDAVAAPASDAEHAKKLFEQCDDHSFVYGLERPIALLGFYEVEPKVWGSWMLHTEEFGRIYRPLTRFLKDALIPTMQDAGARRGHALSLAANTDAHRWFLSLGAVEDKTLPAFGRNGEDFKLFVWSPANVR